jgi:hypothetical protein
MDVYTDAQTVIAQRCKTKSACHAIGLLCVTTDVDDIRVH